MNADVLIVFETGEGQTAKIAQVLSERLRELGRSVALHRAGELPAGLQPSAYRFALIGDSIHAGGFHRPLRRFVRTHRAALTAMPHAAFLVSMSAAQQDPVERRRALDEVHAHFHRQTGWHPEVQIDIAGALMYRAYNPLVRWIMRRIARQAGGQTDTSRNWEYTDWEQVDALARDVAKRVRGAAAPLG